MLRRQPGGPTAALQALQALVGGLQPEDLATALSYCRCVGLCGGVVESVCLCGCDQVCDKCGYELVGESGRVLV